MRYNRRAYEYGGRRYGAPIVDRLSDNRRRVKIGEGKDNTAKAFFSGLGMKVGNKVTGGALGYGMQAGQAGVAATKARKAQIAARAEQQYTRPMDREPIDPEINQDVVDTKGDYKGALNKVGDKFYGKYKNAYGDIKTHFQNRQAAKAAAAKNPGGMSTTKPAPGGSVPQGGRTITPPTSPTIANPNPSGSSGQSYAGGINNAPTNTPELTTPSMTSADTATGKEVGGAPQSGGGTAGKAASGIATIAAELGSIANLGLGAANQKGFEGKLSAEGAKRFKSTLESNEDWKKALEKDKHSKKLGHATTGLGIGSAATSFIPVVGPYISAVSGIAATGTGIAQGVLNSQSRKLKKEATQDTVRSLKSRQNVGGIEGDTSSIGGHVYERTEGADPYRAGIQEDTELAYERGTDSQKYKHGGYRKYQVGGFDRASGVTDIGVGMVDRLNPNRGFDPRVPLRRKPFNRSIPPMPINNEGVNGLRKATPADFKKIDDWINNTKMAENPFPHTNNPYNPNPTPINVGPVRTPPLPSTQEARRESLNTNIPKYEWPGMDETGLRPIIPQRYVGDDQYLKMGGYKKYQYGGPVRRRFETGGEYMDIPEYESPQPTVSNSSMQLSPTYMTASPIAENPMMEPIPEQEPPTGTPQPQQPPQQAAISPYMGTPMTDEEDDMPSMQQGGYYRDLFKNAPTSYYETSNRVNTQQPWKATNSFDRTNFFTREEKINMMNDPSTPRYISSGNPETEAARAAAVNPAFMQQGGELPKYQNGTQGGYRKVPDTEVVGGDLSAKNAIKRLYYGAIDPKGESNVNSQLLRLAPHTLIANTAQEGINKYVAQPYFNLTNNEKQIQKEAERQAIIADQNKQLEDYKEILKSEGLKPLFKNGGRGGEMPNAELEGGEVIERAQGRDKNIPKSTPSHENGGTEETLRQGDYVWSDHLKYKGKSFSTWFKQIKESPMSDSEKTYAIEDLRGMQEQMSGRTNTPATNEKGQLYAQVGILPTAAEEEVPGGAGQSYFPLVSPKAVMDMTGKGALDRIQADSPAVRDMVSRRVAETEAAVEAAKTATAAKKSKTTSKSPGGSGGSGSGGSSRSKSSSSSSSSSSSGASKTPYVSSRVGLSHLTPEQQKQMDDAIKGGPVGVSGEATLATMGTLDHEAEGLLKHRESDTGDRGERRGVGIRGYRNRHALSAKTKAPTTEEYREMFKDSPYMVQENSKARQFLKQYGVPIASTLAGVTGMAIAGSQKGKRIKTGSSARPVTPDTIHIDRASNLAAEKTNARMYTAALANALRSGVPHATAAANALYVARSEADQKGQDAVHKINIGASTKEQGDNAANRLQAEKFNAELAFRENAERIAEGRRMQGIGNAKKNYLAQGAQTMGQDALKYYSDMAHRDTILEGTGRVQRDLEKSRAEFDREHVRDNKNSTPAMRDKDWNRHKIFKRT